MAEIGSSTEWSKVKRNYFMGGEEKATDGLTMLVVMKMKKYLIILISI